MAAAWVVPAFDEVEEGEARVGLSAEAVAIKQFALDRREEALTHGVVVGVADTPHRGPDARLPAAPAEGERGVLGQLHPYLFIGYGYRIYYALGWVFGFAMVGTIVLRVSGEGSRNGMPYGIAYSVDMLLPIIRLRDAHSKIDLRGWARYYFYLHKVMGYVLASFLIAGLSGLTK